jgi:dTDP-4-dehydrorhamnose reductase
MVKILITGSGGMLGRDLCEILGKEHKVAGVDAVEPDTQYPVPDIFYKADISEPDRIKEVFEKEKPELVIHAAAWTDVDGCELDPEKADRVNAAGTEILAKASEKLGIPLIYISTDFVFDGKKNAPYLEEDPCSPINVYGNSKFEGEQNVIKNLSRYAILRTSWLYGRGGKNFVDTIISKASISPEIKVVNDQTGGPTYTRDLARGIQLFIDKKAFNGKDIYHVCNTGRCTWYEFALKIKENARGMENSAIQPISSSALARPAARPGFSVLDTGKFQKCTGTELRKWDEALYEYISAK